MVSIKTGKQKGFTLVEILVALAILMMVLFLGNLAYRSYSVYWYKELGRFTSEVDKTKSIINLHRVIKNFKPMVLQGGKEGGYVYFEGGDSVIRGISNESLVDEKVAAAFELKVTNTDVPNQVRVEYREYPIVNNPVITEDDILPFDEHLVLLKGLDDVRFEYYGWADYASYASFQKSETQQGRTKNKQWFGLYSGKDTLISPEIIKVRLKNDGIWSEIQIPLTHFLHQDLLQFIGSDL